MEITIDIDSRYYYITNVIIIYLLYVSKCICFLFVISFFKRKVPNSQVNLYPRIRVIFDQSNTVVPLKPVILRSGIRILKFTDYTKGRLNEIKLLRI